jgi:hypothetical protein
VKTGSRRITPGASMTSCANGRKAPLVHQQRCTESSADAGSTSSASTPKPIVCLWLIWRQSKAASLN